MHLPGLNESRRMSAVLTRASTVDLLDPELLRNQQ